MPAMDVERATVIEGTDTASLAEGRATTPPPMTRDPEQGDGSAFPGQGETVGIAGHRTTYGAPFNKMDEVEPGDEITLEMPYATFTYEVQKVDIVDPSEIGVVKNVGYERLVLSACHPLYCAAQRIITFAKLEGDQPLRLRRAGSGRTRRPGRAQSCRAEDVVHDRPRVFEIELDSQVCPRSPSASCPRRPSALPGGPPLREGVPTKRRSRPCPG